MFQIQNITANSYQQQTVILPDQTTLFLTLNYIPLQYGWFIQELTYGNLTINNLRITVSPDILYQFKNQLPFGLGCFFTTSNREPTQQQDFASNLFQLYILTKDEVNQYTAFLEGA